MLQFSKLRGSYNTLDCNYYYNHFFNLLYNRVCSIFEWNNLPNTIDVTYLNQALLLNGQVAITKINDNIYAVVGGKGGALNEYYIPTIYTIANPILGSYNFKIGDDCIVINLADTDYLQNKNLTGGILSLLQVTASQLSDIYISISTALKNCRVMAICNIDNEQQKKSAEEVLKQLYEGIPYKVVTNDLISKFTVNPMTNNNISSILQQLIELAQYILANFYHAVGINSNYNLKRERLISDEIDVNQSALKINITDYLANVKRGIDDVNKKYGTNISVKLNKEWRDNYTIKNSINSNNSNDVNTIDNANNQ